MHTEEQHSRSFGVTTTYSNGSGLKSHSSLYFSTDFISVQTTGYSSVGSEDSWTGLRYNISSKTIGASMAARAAIGYLYWTRYFSCI